MRNFNRLKEEKISFGIADIIKDILISLVACLILFLFLNQPLILFIPFSIAAIIGDFIRKCTRPNAISTKGNALTILNNKIYWSIGPQIEAIFCVFIFYTFAQIIGETPASEKQKNVMSDIIESVIYRD